MERRVRTLAVALLALVALAGVGLALTGGVAVDGTVTISNPAGPEISVVTGGGELLLDGPDGDVTTITVSHTDGSVVFEGNSQTGATIAAADITGPTTAVTDLTTGFGLTINPEDKPAATVDGDITALEFRDPALDDGTADATVTGSGELTLRSLPASTEMVAVDAAGDTVDQVTSDDSGEVTVSISSSGTTEISLVTTESPVVDNPSASPSGGTTVSESPVVLSINVSDADFGTTQGDSVDVTFYDAADDSEIGTDTLTGNGTATTNSGPLEGGSNSWYAVATDSYGNELTSQTFTFNAPSTLRLLNESDPDQLVTTNSEVEVTFFSGDQVITRTTTDGTVDLTGLPADKTFTVQVEANGYVTRQAVIQGIVEQQNIYLLPDSVESVATRFTIDDPTGQFATSNTRIAVKKPITKNGSTNYEIVASDIAGEGGYATILQQDQRYLLEVTNTETGSTRSLGPYVATEAQTVNLRIEALDFQFGSNEAGYQWDATYENETEPAISFDWKTTTATAQTLDVTIRERGGDGTVIFDESYTEPEQVSELAIIADSVENPQATTWLVEWEATLADGNTVSGSAVAGPSKLPVEMPNVPDQVVSVLSILVILLVAGLFSAANVTVGAIVTSLTAGGLWFVGATPGAVTGGLVSLALFVAVIAHLRTNQQISPR